MIGLFPYMTTYLESRLQACLTYALFLFFLSSQAVGLHAPRACTSSALASGPSCLNNVSLGPTITKLVLHVVEAGLSQDSA